MNKKRKLGIYLLVSPFALLIISFVLTLLANFVFKVPSTTAGEVSFNIVNIILGITALISVIGIILFPILAIIGIVLIVKNKDEEQVQTPTIETTPQVNNIPMPTESTPVVQQQVTPAVQQQVTPPVNNPPVNI